MTYDKKGTGKGTNIDKGTTIVKVKNGNSMDLSDFWLRISLLSEIGCDIDSVLKGYTQQAEIFDCKT